MKKQGLQVPDSVKAACYAEPVHPSPSPQLTTSSVGSKDQGAVPAQHGVVRSEVAILEKVFVAQTTQAGRKETNVSRN